MITFRWQIPSPVHALTTETFTLTRIIDELADRVHYFILGRSSPSSAVRNTCQIDEDHETLCCPPPPQQQATPPPVKKPKRRHSPGRTDGEREHTTTQVEHAMPRIARSERRKRRRRERLLARFLIPVACSPQQADRVHVSTPASCFTCGVAAAAVAEADG